MKNKLIYIICVAGAFLFYSVNVSASCIGLVPVFGTGDTVETCKALRSGNQSSVPDSSSKQKTVSPSPNNSGVVNSGSNNTNVNLGSFPSSRTEDQLKSQKMLFTKQQLRIELTPYVIPGAYQFDAPGMVEKFFLNGASWEYYFSKSLGFGILWQEWSKTGGRDFDPVQYTDVSGDAHSIALPGAIKRLKYTLYIPYVALSANLSPFWTLGTRLGIGHVGVEAEYKDNAGGNKTYEDNTAMLADLFLKKYFESMEGFALEGFIRYINARYETSDYLEYINLSSMQVGFSCVWMFKNWGVL